MKRKLGNLLFVITALLCFFVLSGNSSILSKAAETKTATVNGTLLEGESFCAAVKNLANGTTWMKYDTADKKVTKIVFVSKTPTGQKSNKSVGTGVTAYYDGKGIISIYSSADKIIFPEDASRMFYDFEKLIQVDFGNGRVNTSKTQNMNSMFCYCNSLEKVNFNSFNTANTSNMSRMFGVCTSLKDLDLSSFTSDKLYTTEAMFSGCEKLTKVTLKNFSVKSVSTMDFMFSNCKSLESIDLSCFGSSSAVTVADMFNSCDSLKNINLSNFSAYNIYIADRMFANCPSLEYLDMSCLDLSGAANTDAMLFGCYNLKAVMTPKATKGFMDFPTLMVIDNNIDGKPDVAGTYHKNPVSNSINRMIPFDENTMTYAPALDTPKDDPVSENVYGAKEITIKGITYRFNSDGSAVVTKITAKGNVSVNKVTYEKMTHPVRKIEAGACKGNKKIKSLSIGKNVTIIGKDAFKGCKKLKKIKFDANKSLKIEKNAFKKIAKKATVSVKGIKGKKKAKLVKTLKKQIGA
ncbi:BspA family leucine-rich repeat surface protein [Butyrivibrio sp. INlla16]|uniref:BspA family leucine-rich repeat surface protein n=1 Tax=Butyrivibrio sp. INlla16 TaxID=1520807 RepID=UPI000885C00E|nr:BspA family leucine-rich repeat surface protein [Butyrivibrio sp. INlla16]SDB21943.1 surface protein [Butyrivibrio sp. INlla16]